MTYKALLIIIELLKQILGSLLVIDVIAPINENHCHISDLIFAFLYFFFHVNVNSH